MTVKQNFSGFWKTFGDELVKRDLDASSGSELASCLSGRQGAQPQVSLPVHLTSKPAKFKRFFLLVPEHLDAFFEPRPPLPSFSFADAGWLRVSFIRPVVAFAYGFALFRVPFFPTRFPADLPLRGKAPRPEQPIPPQTTHTPLPFLLVCVADTQRTTLLAFSLSPSHPLRDLEDTTTLPGWHAHCAAHPQSAFSELFG
ncbi:hypothetical protein B0H14DRAFT_3632833 [Mycena olivaceomarginata]|nr:hypothetical protein B0H14DRAFT_3632833 [Mycena olivaceomarginata]